MTDTLRFAAIGLDHRHIYHLVSELIAQGAECAGYCPRSSDSRVLNGFRERFPDLTEKPREELLADDSIQIIVCAAIPRDRAGLAIKAMRSGKDFMVDKPGAITLDEVDEIEAVARETGQIFSICFSERFVVRACEAASRLVHQGAIGRAIQTVGLGPHRLNRNIRPDWFFDTKAFGGILVDIASHQIDQFLHFTGTTTADIVASTVANRNLPDVPEFEDFGELMLRNEAATGYVRVDWFTPDGLPTWGDGRLFILGTEGTIEIRKYLDIAGRPGTDHLFLSNKHGVEHIDASNEDLTYFSRFLDDVRNRTSSAMPEGHALTVTRLAITAQANARRDGALS